MLAGVLGNVAGSYIAWGVGRYAGQPAVRRWGRRFGVRGHDIDRAVAWFDRHGSSAVLFGRVVPVVRTFISLPAGFADMPAGRFGLFTTLGCIPWTAALGIAGYALGTNWQHIANDFHGPTYAIAGIVVVALAVAVVLYFRRRRAGADVGERLGRTRSRAHRLSRPGRGRTRRCRRAATARTASAARCRAGPCGRSLACRSRPA